MFKYLFYLEYLLWSSLVLTSSKLKLLPNRKDSSISSFKEEFDFTVITAVTLSIKVLLEVAIALILLTAAAEPTRSLGPFLCEELDWIWRKPWLFPWRKGLENENRAVIGVDWGTSADFSIFFPFFPSEVGGCCTQKEMLNRKINLILGLLWKQEWPIHSLYRNLRDRLIVWFLLHFVIWKEKIHFFCMVAVGQQHLKCSVNTYS